MAPSPAVKRLTVLEFMRDDEGVWTVPGHLLQDLARRFPDVRFEAPPDRAAAERLLPEAEVVYGVLVDAGNFSRARRLRWIHVSATGVGSLLFPALVESDVVLTNARGLHGLSMAEHALGVMLSVARKLHLARDLQREQRWGQARLWTETPPFRQLAGATLGLVGLGAVGSALAERAVALGMHVVAVRPHPVSDPAPAHEQWGLERLGDLLERSDWLVLAAPHTPATRGMIGAAQLARMKPDAVLVNLGRGALLDESALVAALRAGRLAGAALDVTRKEPLPPDSPLWTMPNVLLTPHVSGFGPHYWERAVEQFAENVERFLADRPLVNVVDKRAGY
jgi:phosphoglycerate dehydrogenase-like enzyme